MQQDGGVGRGGLGVNLLNIDVLGDQTNSAGGVKAEVDLQVGGAQKA